MAAIVTTRVKAAVRIYTDSSASRLVIPIVVDGRSHDKIFLTFRGMDGKLRSAEMEYLSPNADIRRLIFRSSGTSFDLPDSQPCNVRSGMVLVRPIFDIPVQDEDVFLPFSNSKTTHYCQIQRLNGKLLLIPHNGNAVAVRFNGSDQQKGLETYVVA